MRLAEREIGLDIPLTENQIPVIVIEEPTLRMGLLQELYAQIQGQEGNWLLVENERSYELHKVAEIILEPFSLQLNNKKTKTRLYQDMKEVAQEEFFSESLEVHAHICNLLELLAEKLPYPIRYQDEWSISEVLKSYGIELVEEYEEPCEKLLNYINLVNAVCGTEVFILVNIKQYLNAYQVDELYKLCIYKKIRLILVEFSMEDEKKELEDIYIYDKDRCLIHIE